MNKTVFLLIFLFFSCSENELVLKKLNPDLNLRSKQVTYKNNLYTGSIIELSKDNDTIFKGKFKNGYKSDKWTSFYNNGNVKEIRFYKKGKKIGLYRGFYKNGLIKFEYNFENDEYHGENKAWSEKGVLIQHLTFEKGFEKGLQRLWTNDGAIKSNYIVKNNRRYGLLGTKNCVNVVDEVL